MPWPAICRAIDDLRIGYKISFRRGRVLATRDGAWRAWTDPALLDDPSRSYALHGTAPAVRGGAERRLPWARFRDLEFASPCPLPFREANRARCRWFRREEDEKPRPLVLLGHGWAHQGLEAVERIYVRRLVKSGCDVLLPGLPLHPGRGPGRAYRGGGM